MLNTSPLPEWASKIYFDYMNMFFKRKPLQKLI